MPASSLCRAAARYLPIASLLAGATWLSAPPAVNALDPVRPPKLILWAWDRAEDLRFLKRGQAEVAALMETLYLSRGEILAQRRQLPLQLNEGVRPILVVRLESDGTDLPAAPAVASRIAGWSSQLHPNPRVQIDFDARQSQWPWYADMLSRIPRTGVTLTATALASWCLDSGAAPVFSASLVEVAPMLFRLGPQRAAYLDRLRAAGHFREGCRGAFGVSTDEPLRWHPPAARVYVFRPQPWTQKAFERVCKEWNACGNS